MSISEVIKQHRLSNHLTQEALATELFVSRQLISNWEHGKSYPNLEQIIHLSDFFGISLDELIKGDIPMTKSFDRTLKFKKRFWLLLTIISICLVNQFISTVPLSIQPSNTNISSMTLHRDRSYNGGDAFRDWNTEISATIVPNNPFIRPMEEFIYFEANGNTITPHVDYSFSLWHIFSWYKPVKVTTSLLIDTKIPDKDLYINADTHNVTFI